MEAQDEYVRLLPLLANYLHWPLSELPEALQVRLIAEEFEVGMSGSSWDDLTPNQRRDRLTQIDMDNDPTLKSEMKAFRNLGKR